MTRLRVLTQLSHIPEEKVHFTEAGSPSDAAGAGKKGEYKENPKTREIFEGDKGGIKGEEGVVAVGKRLSQERERGKMPLRGSHTPNLTNGTVGSWGWYVGGL